MTAWLLAVLIAVIAVPAAIFVLLAAHTRQANRESPRPPPLQLSKPQTRLLAEQIADRNERRRALDPQATEILFPPWLTPASSDAADEDGASSATPDQLGP
ncbi:hypothetical protein [Amycolatopsis saalfeldensis]|uniref:Uncharacterized protein n=1 Tax=Amycolatopsis saalfeldensis TaxID=394193 RepID=A0A1H8YNH5_9PSEU|nr:hypothetical protein [Amycolatopsis saalfeldensis]SEP53727.1 hypothetical protein SAMN04489732_13029 [Amycolatopsis saalfeldensis]